MMLKKATGSGMFKPLVVGTDNIEVSHLQFADNTIFMDKATWENIQFIKHFLINLELVSGLKANPEKCSIFGLNVEELRGI